MNVTAQPTIIMLYQPPCGRWYVHSHKMYATPETAHEAARKFLHPETPYRLIDIAELMA